MLVFLTFEIMDRNWLAVRLAARYELGFELRVRAFVQNKIASHNNQRKSPPRWGGLKDILPKQYTTNCFHYSARGSQLEARSQKESILF